MLKDAARIFPSLKGATWKFQWGGHIALTSDGVPHLHEPAPGLIAGLGYNGRGVAMSHVMGREMAQLALGWTVAISRSLSRRFHAISFARLRYWGRVLPWPRCGGVTRGRHVRLDS